MLYIVQKNCADLLLVSLLYRHQRFQLLTNSLQVYFMLVIGNKMNLYVIAFIVVLILIIAALLVIWYLRHEKKEKQLKAHGAAALGESRYVARGNKPHNKGH